jgi:hypothetical protein
MMERPVFCGDLRASGQGELWDHTDQEKFKQFGWRCGTNESSYKPETLVGNWCEEKFDVCQLARPKPLRSQYGHYFETTYKTSYGSGNTPVPECLKKYRGRDIIAFPAHQPQLDHPALKETYTAFVTSSMAAYGRPN